MRDFLALTSVGVHSQLVARPTALMPLAILHFAIVLALIGSVVAGPPPGSHRAGQQPAPLGAKQESALTPEALAAAFRGEWSELQLGILFPEAGEAMGVTIRRVSKPFSLHFTIQATRGGEVGAESRIAYEKVTAILQDLVKYYQTACAETKNEERTLAEARDQVTARRGGARMVMKVSGVGINVSALPEVRTGIAPYCDWLGSLAGLAPTSANPGEPPEKVEAALRKPWTELKVGVHLSETCTGRSHHLAVTFTKTERSIRAHYVHMMDGERRVGEVREVPEWEHSAIPIEALKHYRTAFHEHDGGEESIGEDVHRRLASIGRGEGQSYGGFPIMMYVAGKGADASFCFQNYTHSGSLMNWIAKYESPREDR